MGFRVKSGWGLESTQGGGYSLVRIGVRVESVLGLELSQRWD